MIKYFYNPDIQILEVLYQGEIHSEEIIDYHHVVMKNKKFPRELKILVDARTALYHFETRTIHVLIELLKLSLENYDYIKVAVIHSNPIETAYSILAEINQNTEKYFHKIFSTKDAALRWLL